MTDSATTSTRADRIFAGSLLGVLLLALVLTAIANRLIDPYGVFSSHTIEGFNSARIVDNVRIYKTHQIRKGKYDGVVLGSSRTDSGILPIPGLWGTDQVYNLSMPGATIQEIYRNLQHAHMTGNIQTALIGFDFAMFSAFESQAPTYNEDYFPYREDGSATGLSAVLRTRATALITKDALEKSREIHAESKAGRPATYEQRGTFSPSHFAGAIQKYADFRANFTAFEKTYFKKNGKWLNGPGGKYRTLNPETGYSAVDVYRKILIYCHRNELTLYQFLSPTHVRMLYGRKQIGLDDAEKDWKRALATANRLAAENLARPAFPLFDFALVNSMTTEALKPHADPNASVLRWFEDGVHYTREYGDLVQHTLFRRTENTELAVDLSTRDVEELVRSETEKLNQWATKHPEEAEEINTRLRELNTLGWQNKN